MVILISNQHHDGDTQGGLELLHLGAAVMIRGSPHVCPRAVALRIEAPHQPQHLGRVSAFFLFYFLFIFNKR